MLEEVSSDIYEFEQKVEKGSYVSNLKGYQSLNYLYSEEVDESGISFSQKRPTTKAQKSRKQSVRNSTAKYRDKKKKELQDLELRVKQLEQELGQADDEVEKTKKNIMTALEQQAKCNKFPSHENAEIFHEISTMITKKPQGSTDLTHGDLNQSHCCIDIDKINLLLDTLKYRIGVSGRQRQAKINYHFKSIINTLFPALYRYLLSTAVNSMDLFEEEKMTISWTYELLSKMDISCEQKLLIQKSQAKLVKFFNDIMGGIQKLKDIKRRLKDKGIEMENFENQLREEMDPVQCAHWTLFCEHHKYRKEIAIDEEFQEHRFVLEEDFNLGKPTKKVKKSSH